MPLRNPLNKLSPERIEAVRLEVVRDHAPPVPVIDNELPIRR